MTAQIEKVTDSRMDTQKSLSLLNRFEFTHPSLPHPSHFMRLLSPIILILFSAVYRLGNQLPMSNAITPQLVRHDLPGFSSMASYQTLEEPLSRNAITLCLQKDINHFAVLINCPPQVMLFAVDFDKDFVDVEGITIAAMLSLKPTGINRSKLDAPEADRFTADSDASLS
jgi:hypothetical protein